MHFLCDNLRSKTRFGKQNPRVQIMSVRYLILSFSILMYFVFEFVPMYPYSKHHNILNSAPSLGSLSSSLMTVLGAKLDQNCRKVDPTSQSTQMWFYRAKRVKEARKTLADQKVAQHTRSSQKPFIPSFLFLLGSFLSNLYTKQNGLVHYFNSRGPCLKFSNFLFEFGTL